MLLKIYDIIQSESAVTPKQGNLVFSEIQPYLKNLVDIEDTLAFDFDNITDLTTAFLNNCLGRLFNILPTEYLIKNLSFENISNSSQVNSIRLTIETALLNIEQNS